MSTTFANVTSKIVISKQDSYVGSFKWSQPDLVYFEREDHNEKGYSETDTNPNHWGFFWVKNLPENLVAVKTSNGVIPILGTMALWLPPFSLIEWRISPGTFRWQGYLSSQTVPPNCPKEAVGYVVTEQDLPQTTAEVFSFLLRTKPLVVLERNNQAPLICRKLKESIQLRFKDNLFIGDVASEQGVSHEYLVRAFRKAYGLTPVYLRSRLRVFSAIIPLLQGAEVSTVAFDSGFSDLGRFTKQFTKFMKVSPVQFQMSR